MKFAMGPEFITIGQMATLFGVSESTCRRLVASGEVEAIKVRRAVRVSVRSIERFAQHRDYLSVKNKEKGRLTRLKHKLVGSTGVKG